jgi:hypothetical protein
MKEGMSNAQQMLADWEFKKAIAKIELRKFKKWQLSNSLLELKFITSMDSSMFANVEFWKGLGCIKSNAK